MSQLIWCKCYGRMVPSERVLVDIRNTHTYKSPIHFGILSPWTWPENSPFECAVRMHREHTHCCITPRTRFTCHNQSAVVNGWQVFHKIVLMLFFRLHLRCPFQRAGGFVCVYVCNWNSFEVLGTCNWEHREAPNTLIPSNSSPKL